MLVEGLLPLGVKLPHWLSDCRIRDEDSYQIWAYLLISQRHYLQALEISALDLAHRQLITSAWGRFLPCSRM